MKLDLSRLGTKIVIIGLSNSGKSTLAAALSERLDLAVCHLDQLAFKPEGRWQYAPDDEFEAAVADVARQPRWIMEGVYDNALAIALPEATSVIYLTTPRHVCLYRYLRSCWHRYQGEYEKKGIHANADLSFSRGMARAILWDHPRLRPNIEASLKGYSGPIYRGRNFTL